MVRALLDNRKTQTRRIVKPQPTMHEAGDCTIGGNRGPIDYLMREIYPQYMARFRKGDRLWVRENLWLYGRWRQEGTTAKGRPSQTLDLIGKVVAFEKPADIAYYGGKAGFAFRPGIHMPRWASRLTLTVTDVRVQRLQEIDEADAIAEGIEAATAPHEGWQHYGERDGLPGIIAVDSYRTLWDSINGAGAWKANPWVVAVTFTVERRNIDA